MSGPGTASDSTFGVDLGGTKALFLCGDTEERLETGRGFSPAAFQQRLRDFITKRAIRPLTIGIAVPGLVDLEGRLSACDVLPEFAGWDARQAFADLGCRITVANDVKAALAEEMHDAAPGTTAGVVMAGTAIGAAFLTEGRPLLGASGFAGELGHLPVIVNGEVKHLDQLAGGSFIASGLGVSSGEPARPAHAGGRACCRSDSPGRLRPWHRSRRGDRPPQSLASCGGRGRFGVAGLLGRRTRGH